MATTTTTTTTRVRQLLSIGAVAGVAATVVNATIYGLGRAAGVDYVAQRDASGVDRIQLQHVVSLSVTSFAIGLAAAAVVVKLRRPGGLRALQVLGVVIAAVSTYGDFGIDGSAAAKVTLILMHAVVGAAYVVTLQRVRAVAAEDASAPVVAERELAPLAA